MSQPLNKYENALLGHALANNFQATTYMAIEFSRSLQSLNDFDAIDVMSHYLYLYYKFEYPMGEVVKIVYEDLKSDIKSKKSKLTREEFRFSLARIRQASELADRKLNGLSAGCNPAQRSYPLVFCPWIEDEKLFDISYQEAQLTHFSSQAGQVSGIINLISRRLIKGDSWNDAINFAFNTAPSDLARDIKEIQDRYEHDPVLNPHRDPGYAPNVLHTTLYCVTRSNSYEDALTLASNIDRDYCPTSVGLLAAIRWDVPPSIINNSHNEQINVLKQIAKDFSKEWKKYLAITNGTKTSFFSKIFH